MRIRALTAAALFAILSVFAVGGVAAAQEAPAEEEHGESKATHAGEECIEILEKGGKAEQCHDAPSPIIPETKEIVWGSISFLAVLFLMMKFAYPALKKSMDARTEKIRGNLDDAERVKDEAAKVLEDYKRQLRRALENYFNGEFDDASRDFSDLTRKLPDNAWIWAFLGASQYSQYAFEADESYRAAALKSFRKAKTLRTWKGGLPEKYFSKRIRRAFDREG